MRLIISNIIEEIIVYSRPINEKNTIAGRKVSGQRIPYKLHIKLKLPQEFLQDLVKESNAIYDQDVKEQLKKLGHKVEFKNNKFEVKSYSW